MMCRGSVVDAVSTFKIYKTATLVKIKLDKISLESQLVSSAAVHEGEIIVLIYFSSTLRAGWHIPRRVIL